MKLGAIVSFLMGILLITAIYSFMVWFIADGEPLRMSDKAVICFIWAAACIPLSCGLAAFLYYNVFEDWDD